VSDGRAGEAVTSQRNRTVPDAKYGGVELSDPVLAARRLPIFLLNPMVFRMLDSPKALPMLGAGVEKPGNEQD